MGKKPEKIFIKGVGNRLKYVYFSQQIQKILPQQHAKMIFP